MTESKALKSLRTGRVKAYHSLRAALLSSKDTTIEHVCLTGAEQIYNSQLANFARISDHCTETITFLTKDRRAFANYLGAETQRPSTTVYDLSTRKVNSKETQESDAAYVDADIKIRIVEAGKNFLPSRMENDILGRRIVYQNAIFIPEPDGKFWATLYMLLVHEGRFTALERSVMEWKLTDRYGSIIKCKYGDIEHYPNRGGEGEGATGRGRVVPNSYELRR